MFKLFGYISIILIFSLLTTATRKDVNEGNNTNHARRPQTDQQDTIIKLLSSAETHQNSHATDASSYRYFYSDQMPFSSSYDLTAQLYLFNEFRITYNKTYATVSEAQNRFRIFTKNMELIHQFKKTEKGTASYGATEFADLTVDEFFKFHTGYVKNENVVRKRVSNLPVDSLPVSRDWRQSGAVTGVKNQGSCGSCWAFSSTGNIEGVWKLKKGELVSLSEQQLVDCDRVDAGCSGGDMLAAYKEIERMGGLETEGEYPYHARRSKSCTFNTSEVKVYINDTVSLPINEEQIAAYVDAHGPVSIGINASPLMFYTGGIAHPWRFFCSPKRLNHGVLIVGFGVQGDKPYWIIKNSWGARWGESGYFRLFRGQGVCGVDQDANSVVVR